MGVVYKAKDPFIGRYVALKTITTGLQEQPELLQRFYREAQAAGGLQHPNVVTIYDLGEADATPYIAMEFLEGEDLERIINEQRQLPLSQKIGYMVQVARALDYAHKRGVVHRDIKPANIVVTKDGTIKVVDFGIARLVDTSRSQTGLLIGTVNYMSPEQVRGERVDGRSDIFSLGVMFYELVSYQRPFPGNNFTAVMLAIISSEQKPLHEAAPDTPPELEGIVHKLLRKDVNDRYQALDEFLIDIDPLWKRLQHETVSDLVAQSQKLLEKKDLAKARELLRQAVLIDTSHKQAKTLLEKVNAELKRSMVAPQTEEHVRKAEALLKDGKFNEATAEAEAALKLDSVCQPAQELLQKIKDEVAKAQLVKDYLKTTKQRLAEGSLTEAEQSLKKALELQSDSKEGIELRKQLDEEKLRREKRKKLQDTLQQARTLWTQQKHDECIQLLTGLLKEFPNETEVAKMLETVREDQAEQQKHQVLAEAKNLLAAQRFADALSVLNPLVERYKDDSTVIKLYDHIQQERKVHAQRVRLERETAALKKLVTEEKYQEALNKGESLLQEFPDEVEVARLVDFARSQQAQIEQQKKLKAKINEVQALVDRQDWEKAAKAADAALELFPGNSELRYMLDEARTRQQEKERKEYVEKQIRSIKAAIDKGNLTGAIEMGKQTIAVVKHDTDVTQLIQFAERERELRDLKKNQDDQLKTVAILLKKEQFEEAGKILDQVQKTQIFDPRVHELMRAVQEKRAPAEKVLEQPAPGATVAQQYVYAPGRPGEPEVVGPRAEATPVAEPKASASPMPVTPTPVPPPQVVPPAPVVTPEPAKPEPPRKGKPVVEEPPKKKGKPVVEEPPKKVEELPKKAKPAVEEPPKKLEEPPKKPVETKPAVVEPPKKVEEPKARPTVEAPPKPAPRPAPRPEVTPPIARPIPVEAPKRSPALMMGIAAVVVIGAAIGWFVLRGREATPGGGTPGAVTGTATAEETALMDQATRLYGQRQLEAALAKYKDLSGKNGTLKSQADAKVSEIEGLFQKEQAAFSQAQSAQKQKNWAEAKSKYNDVIQLDGKLKTMAQKALDTVAKLEAGADVAAIERDTFQQAMDAARREDWGNAQALLTQVIGMSGANKARAQAELKRVDAQLKFKDGEAFFNNGQRAEARAKFQEVVGLGGDLARRAEARIRDIDAAINAENLLRTRMDEINRLIDAGQLGDARTRIGQLGAGVDASALNTKLAGAEQKQFDDLVNRFNQNKSNETALRQLQPEFGRVAREGGSKATEARNYADTLIPTALTEIKRASDAAIAEAAEKKAFDDAVIAFNANLKDEKALNSTVKPMFEKIANAGGKYATDARDYVANRVPAAILAAKPCPKSFPAVAPGSLAATPKSGATIAAELLDKQPAWTTCPFPMIKNLTMLTLTVAENGDVVEVKPRAPSPDFEAAKAAVMKWKASPALTSKGVAVKTTVSVDFKP
jgi:serine/threonine-protein kinase